MANSESKKSWDPFLKRRPRETHALEATRLLDQPCNTKTFLKAFFELKHKSNWLEPPADLTYLALKNYLTNADFSRLTSSNQGQIMEDTIIQDDRRHESDRAPSGRFDNDREKKGFVGYSGALTVKSFYELALKTKRHEPGANAERRTVFIASPTPDHFLALAGTVGKRSAHALREYLQNYLVFRACSDIFCTTMSYTMEIQIPYFALRLGTRTEDDRRLYDGPFRKSEVLPLAHRGHSEPYTSHEAKISLLITGSDDFFWNSICFVDAHFGSERSMSTYPTFGTDGLDPASCQALEFPFWNARKYFLAVYAQRFGQVTSEWRNLILAFDGRMKSYKGSISCFDNAELKCTQDLEHAVNTIEAFKSCLHNTISSWENFKDRDLHWFDVRDNADLSKAFGASVTNIEKCVKELISYRELLKERFVEFEGRLGRVMTATAVQHNAMSTQLGYYMRLVAGITFFFSAVSLVPAVFGMNFVSSHISAAYPATAFVAVAGLAYWLVLQPHFFQYFVPIDLPGGQKDNNRTSSASNIGV